VIAAHGQKFPSVAAPTLQFNPVPYETFDESADLYKDGSVVVVPLRGHTPGSVGIFVNYRRSDGCFTSAMRRRRARIQERVGKSMILLDSDNAGKVAESDRRPAHDLHEKVPGLAIIPRMAAVLTRNSFRAGRRAAFRINIRAEKKSAVQRAGPRKKADGLGSRPYTMQLVRGGLGLLCGLNADESAMTPRSRNFT